jgi:formylglycine-generating enzyme required for sulfatase activity
VAARRALGGANGEEGRALARQLFAKASPLTLNQWRGRTEMPFTATPAALLSSDPDRMVHAVDLVLPPGGASMRLIRIDSGKFNHGSPTDEIGRRPSDFPSASVVIAKTYFIGKFEVTQKQYESVMKRSPSYWRGHPTWPVDQVTWNDLMGPTGFITQLNSALNKTFDGVLVADLPTDDEWEYACRAGETTTFNNGRDIKNLDADPALAEIAHYNKVAGGPIPVGSLTPNAWGLYDMHGNLQEWTQDRSVRGGSWQSKAAACRAAARIQMSREAGGANQTGFPLVLRDPATGR